MAVCRMPIILNLVFWGAMSSPLFDFGPPPLVCESKGKVYQIDEAFNIGCFEKCVCADVGGFPLANCSSMCGIVDTLCKMIPNPNADPETGTNCCEIKDPSCTDCLFETPRGSGNIVVIPGGEARRFATEWCRCNANDTVTCWKL